MRPQLLIAVTDVEASSRWYQRLLGCTSTHDGSDYDRLVVTANLSSSSTVSMLAITTGRSAM